MLTPNSRGSGPHVSSLTFAYAAALERSQPARRDMPSLSSGNGVHGGRHGHPEKKSQFGLGVIHGHEK
jgi:hypothetical protein